MPRRGSISARSAGSSSRGEDRNDAGAMTLLEKRMLEKKTSTFLLDEDIRSVFSQFDRDGNGYLGASDLAAVYRSLGEHLDDDLVSSPRSLIHTSLRRAWSMPRRVQWVCNPYFKHPEHGCSDGVPQIDELIREADKDGDGQIGAYHPRTQAAKLRVKQYWRVS
jgi:hypothetical protein